MDQVDYDPKVHGAGTHQIEEPQSVRELFKYVQSLKSRLAAVEQKAVSESTKAAKEVEKQITEGE